MKYNPHIHNRRSMRLKGYDYSQEGAYFITICCKDRACLLGKIINREMILNANGIVAYKEWLITTEIRSNVELDVFVIMPNHIHGIIIINNRVIDRGRGVLHTPGLVMGNRENETDVLHTPMIDNAHPIELKTNAKSNVLHTYITNQGVCNTPLQETDGRVLIDNTPLRSPSNNIGAIVRGYKSAVTKQMNILGLDNYKQSATVWQRNFHDHIIRDEKEYQTISNYIVNNPGSWNEDRFYEE